LVKIKQKGFIMPRKHRIDEVGFYHIVNRGVARRDIYKCDEDYFKFLDIVQDASDEYDFKREI
jgi:hypothetical protein